MTTHPIGPEHLDNHPSDRKTHWLGPICVASGASLWGAETLWRVMLNKRFASDVLVLWEHVYCILFSLPILWINRHLISQVPKKAWLFLLGSGVFGSAIGTVCFTQALKTNNYTLANVLLNIQPLFSALFARWILEERFGKGFFLWAGLAILCGMGLSFKMESLTEWVISPSVLWIFATATCWGFATVMGRGTMTDIPLGVAAPCRFLIGFVAMIGVVALNGHLLVSHLNIPAFSEWGIHQDFILLSVVAGVIPLFLYFKGLSLTHASIASFFEMAQILASLLVTWGLFGQTLSLQQIIAGIFLLVAVTQINRVQEAVA